MIQNNTNKQLNRIFYSDFLPISSPEYLQTWVELSQSAIESNAQQFQQWLGHSTKIAGVIKSNAYGHGILPIATMYESCTTIASLCVINLYEAVYLRTHGIKKPILVIGYLDAFYDLIIKHDIEVVLYDFDIAEKLNDVGKKHNQQIVVHIKFDTGMSRLGIIPCQLDDFIHKVRKLDYINIKGIFSHFAESYHVATTHAQENVFAIAAKYNLVTHISNSHGTLTTKNKNYSCARIGIGLYGYLQRHSPDMQNLLRPVLSLKTRILQIKEVSANSFVGYDATYQAKKDMIIAIIAIGYTEGLDARLSNCGSVIINEQFAPIIGRVCMNLTIIDISHINNCSPGQIVTVLGRQGKASITAYDWSNTTKASVYNHLTKIAASLTRIITD